MEFEASIEFYNEALMSLKETRDKRRMAKIHNLMANILAYPLGRYEDGLAHYNEVLRILKNEPESPELANVYYNLAYLHLRFLGNLSKAVPLGRKALSLAEKLGDLSTKAELYIDLVFTELADLQKAAKYAEEGLKIAKENNDHENAVYGHCYVPLYYISLGDFHKAMECLEEGVEFVRRVSYMSYFFGAMIGEIAWTCAYTGDLQKAIETAEEAIKTTKRTGDLMGLCLALQTLGEAYRTMGEWDKAHEYYMQALEIAERTHDKMFLSMANSLLGRLCCEKEEYGKAKEFLRKAFEVAEKFGGKIRCPVQLFWWGFVPYVWLSEVHLKMDKFKKAKDLADQAYECAVKSKSRLYMAVANRLNGMLSSSQRDWKSAIGSFEKSKREFEAMGALPELIPTLYEYGSTYLQRNQDGDREKAHSLLDQALEISRKIGAKKWLEKIIAKKKLLTA